MSTRAVLCPRLTEAPHQLDLQVVAGLAVGQGRVHRRMAGRGSSSSRKLKAAAAQPGRAGAAAAATHLDTGATAAAAAVVAAVLAVAATPQLLAMGLLLLLHQVVVVQVDKALSSRLDVAAGAVAAGAAVARAKEEAASREAGVVAMPTRVLLRARPRLCMSPKVRHSSSSLPHLEMGLHF